MSMPKWIDPKITVGNILTIAVLLFGFFSWGIQLAARVDKISEEMSALKAQDVKIDDKLANLVRGSNDIEKMLLPRLTRIETILERIEKKSSTP